MPSLSLQDNTLFVAPPLDGALSIPEIYDFNYRENGDHPLFLYDERDNDLRTIRWRDAVQAIHTAAKVVRSIKHINSIQNRLTTVAIFAVVDQLSYFALIAGIMRAGFCPFPISPRNSAVAVANLLQKMDVNYVFVSKDQATQKIATSACKILSAAEPSATIELVLVPSFYELYNGDGSFAPLPPMHRVDVLEPALILHSSGSTSFPKPIVLSHLNLIQWGSQPYYGEVDICGRILSNHALPFFHAMGIVSLMWAAMTGLTLANFAPRDPPVVTTSESVYNSAVATNSKLIFCVPTYLEEWSQYPERLAKLKEFNAVIFGGAPIQKSVGDTLHKNGVQLFPFYGATELGGTSKFLPDRVPADSWEYFKISPHTKPSFLKEEGSKNVFRIMFQLCSTHQPAVLNTESTGIRLYDTNDLLVQHPTDPELWKISGRVDDQIMHSTGEKTNPVPMEIIINQHPMIRSSLMFGRGRIQAGVLIEPLEPFDPTNYHHLDLFKSEVWPTIEGANRFGPSHSRIFKEMILVTNPSKPFKFTAKGTPRRHVILSEYEEEIEGAYIAFEEHSETELDLPNFSDLGDCVSFVRKTITSVLLIAKDTDDLFQNGCDSLKAVWVRNRISQALLQLQGITRANISNNFVYLNPTIERLASYMYRVANKLPLTHEDGFQGTIKEMDALVKKYSTSFPLHEPSDILPGGEVILLTGSTGCLGSFILENLILNPSVSKIYAFNRKSAPGTGSQARQASAFVDKGIELALLDSPKLVFIEGDASLQNLGLSECIYNELRKSITCIMHIAWHVDFNIAISTLEPLIAGTRHLIELALGSSHYHLPRFVFASSIGVVRNWQHGTVPEAPVLEAGVAVGSGYPESKWVAERILTRVAEDTGLRPIIVRIGQLSGGRTGYWNPDEWVPSIVLSGHALRCLPSALGYISWIPVHVAAAALVEMRTSNNMFLHLVHPRPTKWDDVFHHISDMLQVPLVSYPEWLSALEYSTRSEGQVESEPRILIKEQIPALPLLDFYRSANKPLPSIDSEAFGFPRLSTMLALKNSPSLHPANLPQLGVGDVNTWLAFWAKAGRLRAGVMVDGNDAL